MLTYRPALSTGHREFNDQRRPDVQTWDVRSLDVEPHSPKVLHSNDEGRTIVINLPAGEELQEHEVHERSWVVVVDGQIELEGAGETITGGAGFLAHIDPKEVNEIRAISDTRLIMVLAPWPGEGHPSQKSSA
jgi:quercetin dioxygenase-like cupin family protein